MASTNIVRPTPNATRACTLAPDGVLVGEGEGSGAGEGVEGVTRVDGGGVVDWPLVGVGMAVDIDVAVILGLALELDISVDVDIIDVSIAVIELVS